MSTKSVQKLVRHFWVLTTRTTDIQTDIDNPLLGSRDSKPLKFVVNCITIAILSLNIV